MKKYLFNNFIFLLFILLVNTVYGNVSSTTNERTKAFIQVWGLVKYKSINGAQGKFNADSIFLALLDKVKAADENQFRELITTLLKENPGQPEVNKTMLNNENLLTKNIDYSWMKNKLFTATIQKQLSALTKTYNPNKTHYFIPNVAYEGELPHENAYPNYTFDNDAMNLLALAKAWNAIAYLFPYRYVMGQKWELTLQKLIPTFSAIKSRAAYEKSILLLESAIDDTHASGFLSQVQRLPEIFDLKYYPSFAYKIYENQLLITEFLTDSLAQTSSLKTGDLIVSINGVKTKEWLKQRSTLLPASNQSVKNRLLANNDALAFSAINNPTLKVRIKRDHTYLTIEVVLLERKEKKVGEIVNTYFKQKATQDKLIKGYEDLPNDIALIRAGYFFDRNLPSDTELMAFSQNLNKKKAIIFDMRKYPAAPGLFYYYLPMALGKPAFKFAQYYGADISNPGVFLKQDGIEVFLSKDIATEMPLYKGKIVILTNENTQSMGEWYTMMLRQINSNTTVIGSQTAGADGDTKHLNLPGGYEFLFTGSGIFYPNGKETQRIGIVPDLLYQPSVKDLLSTTDKHLEKALEYLKNK
jgi:carboxyl-terminal processing protease